MNQFNIRRLSQIQVKDSIKKFIFISFALVLLSTSVSQAFAASITSSRFYLYRNDGPMYIDFSANCSQLAAVDVHNDGGRLDKQRGALNGTWRGWMSLSPRTNYTLDLVCQDTSGRGTAWRYNVWFSGNTMRVNLTHVLSW